MQGLSIFTNSNPVLSNFFTDFSPIIYRDQKFEFINIKLYNNGINYFSCRIGKKYILYFRVSGVYKGGAIGPCPPLPRRIIKMNKIYNLKNLYHPKYLLHWILRTDALNESSYLIPIYKCWLSWSLEKLWYIVNFR